ncbi:hypothetical protein HPB48_010063 [Haemaphysalis longicornis]|uniref:CCHC-type domain-containing protein n=1 Tax=Haemaphysalis longicornis TaxID=44386 RepID=A0A9J6FU27_HAELO|nr:hypothetical protein HPB48_010063 [Haemaphysalis longicornis]
MHRTPTGEHAHKRRQQPKKKPPPPAERLPEDDIKIVLRPQGGLYPQTVPAASLADLVQRQANITHNNKDQLRVNQKSNFIGISTPSEARSKQYLQQTTLQYQGATYLLSNHIPQPSNNCVGVIFNAPTEDDASTILRRSLTYYNPALHILDAERLHNSSLVQILFNGTTIPYWVRYRAAIVRSYPFKRKPEACFNCWRPGHRQDVCPHTPPTPRCTKCGSTTPTENHRCNPNCILCGDSHLTGAACCLRRFQPRRPHQPPFVALVSQTEHQP